MLNKNFYITIFKNLKNILTINGTEKLFWKTITIDFEKSLISGNKEVINDIKLIGCLSHFIKMLD